MPPLTGTRSLAADARQFCELLLQHVAVGWRPLLGRPPAAVRVVVESPEKPHDAKCAKTLAAIRTARGVD